ncbi:GTP-binding protein [Clostridium sp. AL.422]|uniref:GTP-binding protein n=1 Tax=Clostridium TaxID=1485 RepID=UPI00293DACA5|nr:MULTISPECIES: GTP-binding protein [unclassified Clostridium]MDV4149662.1 GTP-binding protein [Clostridium sp. AL.422]
MKAKLEVVSGFLGSGKTSFINAYLNTEMCLGKNILIILLESGASRIRSNLKNVKVVYLEETEKLKKLLLKEIIENEYSKIIIELNGTNSLNIIGEVLKDKQLRQKINFYGSYYIGDCKNLKLYLKNLGEIIIPFIQSSKLIILNNIAILEKSEQNDLINIIEEINLTAPIVLSNSPSTLDTEIKSSKYFKEGTSIKKIKSLLYKKEVVK